MPKPHSSQIPASKNPSPPFIPRENYPKLAKITDDFYTPEDHLPVDCADYGRPESPNERDNRS
jgi:hypothetical protein